MSGTGFASIPTTQYYGVEYPEFPNRVGSISQTMNQPMNQQSMNMVQMPMMMVQTNQPIGQQQQTMMMAPSIKQPLGQQPMNLQRLPSLTQASHPLQATNQPNNMSMVEPMMQSSIPYYTYGFDQSMGQQINQPVNQYSYFVPMPTYSMGMMPTLRNMDEDPLSNPSNNDSNNQSNTISRPLSRNQSLNQPLEQPSFTYSTAYQMPMPMMSYGQSINQPVSQSLNQSLYQPMYAYDPSYGFSNQAIDQSMNQANKQSTFGYPQYVTFPTSMQPTVQPISSMAQPMVQSLDMSYQQNNQSNNQLNRKRQQQRSSNPINPPINRTINSQPITQPINIPSKYQSDNSLLNSSSNQSDHLPSFYTNLLSLRRSTHMLLSLPIDDHCHAPLFVSNRQYNQILKRRELRKNDRRTRIKAKHRSRQLHASRRVRGQGGRFLTKAEKDKLNQSNNEITTTPVTAQVVS